MLGYLIAAVVIAIIAFVLFSPWLKGIRTNIAGYLTVIGGALIPLVTEVIGYLQTLDWRQYLLEGDKKNLYVLAVVGGLGVLMVILRYKTTGPVGTTE